MIVIASMLDRQVEVSMKGFRNIRIPKKLRNDNHIKSNYALYLITYNHNYTVIHTNLVPLYVCEKSRFMNALEELEIYGAYTNTSTREFTLYDQLNFEFNLLYDTTLSLLAKS